MKKMREITIQIVNITGKMIKTKIIEDIKIEMRENTMTMIEEGLLIEEIIEILILEIKVLIVIVQKMEEIILNQDIREIVNSMVIKEIIIMIMIIIMMIIEMIDFIEIVEVISGMEGKITINQFKGIFLHNIFIFCGNKYFFIKNERIIIFNYKLYFY